jgi:hypothetical protein
MLDEVFCSISSALGRNVALLILKPRNLVSR